MFGIGSVSKMIAAIAVMKLVEQGLVELDTPLVTYLPNFRMVSPEYKNITVRMLLNHAAGFPGTDYRNALIRNPSSGYLDQVLQTLSKSRLKAPPGYMNVYCNDCFTLVEAMVAGKTGKSYVQFVQDEILTPLKMSHTRYPLGAFPDKSYAKARVNGITRPQEYVNTLAGGGVYSTSKDMARIAMMFLNGGKAGDTRMLSADSVVEMAKDQTKGSFNPVHNNSFTYGLGWDSVSQPGLLAVGFDGWAKGGDSNDYGAMMIVSPKAGLGVVVIGVSNFGSEKAKVIGERVLVRALAENKLIPEFPSPLKPVSLKPVSASSAANSNGSYAMFDNILNVQGQGDGGLQLSILSEKDWMPLGVPLRSGDNGWYTDPLIPLNSVRVIETDVLGKQNQYIEKLSPSGYGHYLDFGLVAQKVEGEQKEFSAAWKERLHRIWLVVNEHPDELSWNGMDPRLRLSTVPSQPGLLVVRPVEDGKFHVVNPSTSDTKATMMLVIPQLNGRDLNDLIVFKRDGEEWMRFGSYIHQPLSTVAALAVNEPVTLTIGPEGYAEWRAIADNASPQQLVINSEGEWRLYDSEFKSVEHGQGKAVVTIPAGKGISYLTVFGALGETITLSVDSGKGSVHTSS